MNATAQARVIALQPAANRTAPALSLTISVRGSVCVTTCTMTLGRR